MAVLFYSTHIISCLSAFKFHVILLPDDYKSFCFSVSLYLWYFEYLSVINRMLYPCCFPLFRVVYGHVEHNRAHHRNLWNFFGHILPLQETIIYYFLSFKHLPIPEHSPLLNFTKILFSDVVKSFWKDIQVVSDGSPLCLLIRSKNLRIVCQDLGILELIAFIQLPINFIVLFLQFLQICLIQTPDLNLTLIIL